METEHCLRWGFCDTSTTSHGITVRLPNGILTLRRTIRAFVLPDSLEAGPAWVCGPTRTQLLGPLIKADWGLSTVSPSVQQRHSVWDYHTCGSGINPSRDMGTRDQGAPKVQCRKGGGVRWHPKTLPPWAHVGQQVGKVGIRCREALSHKTWCCSGECLCFFLCLNTTIWIWAKRKSMWFRKNKTVFSVSASHCDIVS